MTPARFPRKFCQPVHRAAILGPTSVCVIAEILDPHMPPAANASSSRITETVGPARAQPKRNSPAVPAPAKVLRTRGGVPPVGDPTENYRGSRVAQVSQPANFPDRTHRKVALTQHIKWQPGDIAVQHLVCDEK